MVIIQNFMSLHENSLFEITVNLMLSATKENEKWGEKNKKGKRKVTEKNVLYHKSGL